MKIGFIGLGIMGKNMARNLLKAGYSLVVFDIVKIVMDEVEESGAKIASSPAEVARQLEEEYAGRIVVKAEDSWT